MILRALIPALFLATPAFAQEQPQVPAIETVALPDMSSANDPAVAGDGWKYFYFHKQGISYAAAYADFSDCYRFQAAGGGSAALPMFAPWREKPNAKPVEATASPYGLVGDVILSMVMGPIDRRLRQSRMRRCLEPRGYVRYPLAKPSWEKLIDNYSTASIAMQAKVASGPRPNAEVVTR